jgi:hypothetical protein
MDELDKQIEQMAETMEKSTQESENGLFTLIKSLGPEGLKKKLPTLSDDEKVVLKSALEEMNKAISFDKEAQAVKYVKGNINDTIIQEDKVDDDADEKLVKPEAAKMNNQGTPTDGWDGQVIKSLEDDESAMDQLIEKAMDKCNDDKMVMKKLKEKGMDEAKVQGAVDRYKAKKDVKKSEEIEKGKMKENMDRESAKEKIMQMEEKEHGTKNPKKLVEAEKKEDKMKKSETEDLEKAKMNKEEDQLGDAPEMNEKTMGKKSPAPDIEDNAKANKKNMTKSCNWEDENKLIKANTLGRNFNFNVENFIEETLKLEGEDQPIVKSEVKEDLNDIIEKGNDTTWGEISLKKQMDEAKSSGTLVKSFDDIKDVAATLGISEEEAKKILGE